MNPDLLWIEGRCYRLPLCDPAFNGGEESNEKETDNYDSYESKLVCTEEEPCDVDYDIEETNSGRFKMKFVVPRTFWSYIIGSKGATKKRIENDTKTIITIPRQAEAGTEITITGPTKRSIILARRNIDVIVASARQKLPFTHFLSIPMNSSQIKENFASFKDSVLRSCGDDRGIDSSIFQTPGKLHLTLGTLFLSDNKERKLAIDKLEHVCGQIVKPLLSHKKSLVIEMSGIEYMNDDPYEVDVLYAKVKLVDGSNLLQQAADSVVQHFVDTGYLKKEDVHEVKLHVTLMNTLFRDEKKDEISEEQNSLGNNKSWRNKKTRTTFNASNVLKQYRDYYFGKQEFKEIHLSLRYSTASDGYYQSSYIAKL